MSKKHYNRPYKELVDEESNEIYEEAVAEEIEEEEIVEECESCKVIIGRVTGCDRLNVRSAPSSKAEVICVIDKDTAVIVDNKASTKDFYKVCIASGIEGFCMASYIEIQ